MTSVSTGNEYCPILGPFLGATGSTSVRVCLGLPDSRLTTVSCTIEDGTGKRQTHESPPRQGIYKIFSFDFSDLSPDETYRYSFRSPDGDIDLGGLTFEDLSFRPIGQFNASESFILLSCHHPFSERDCDGWVMWRRLEELTRQHKSIRLLILGGDQVYHDAVEQEFVSKLESNPDDPKIIEDLRKALIKNYQKFWSDKVYRQVLARIPSVAMWDDHDITDGWGGRSASFNANHEITPHWKKYFEIAREAFYAYQTVRNPAKLANIPEGVSTCSLDWGSIRFYLCDFRTEKNSQKKQFWTSNHEATFCKSLEGCSANQIFLLSPVVPARFDPDLEEGITYFTKLLWKLKQAAERRNYGNGSWWQRALYMLIKLLRCVSDLSDDLEDGLMASCNRESFVRLLRALFQSVQRGRKVLILSGDIHTAGISEFVLKIGDDLFTIPQIVSSPIAHKPLYHKVEGATTAVKEISIKKSDQEVLLARNGPYYADRNFAQIFPARFNNYREGFPVVFHFENHSLPIALPASFTP